MAKKMSSSQHEMVHEQRPVMSANLLSAAINGNEDVLLQCLGLTKEQNEVKVTIEASHSHGESELQSATRFGDTVLHLLLTRRHNKLAFKVFRRDMSLLKAQNKMSETPLHCAAKVGNEEAIRELIKINHAVVKDALEEINENGDTALHIAAKHGHIKVGAKLMILDPEAAYKVNSEMSSPLYMAIVNGHTEMAQTMLTVDPNMARTQVLDGMFPAHVAARTGNIELVKHFMQWYPDGAELLDPRGRNLFHTAVEKNQIKLVGHIFGDTSVGEMVARMSNAKDYDGNTPFHVAAMMQHRLIMRVFFDNNTHHHAETIKNNDGFTPFDLWLRQGGDVTDEENIMTAGKMAWYTTRGIGKFTRKWFDDIMEPSLPNTWERIQVIGLGSVLITTVTFAAAFTIPGGYDQNHGTPVLGRRYMLRAFIMANALAFIGGFLSLFMILDTAITGKAGTAITLSAVTLFSYSANWMIVAFGLGMYVTLAPVCLPIAILLLVVTLLIGWGPTREIFRNIGINWVRNGLYSGVRSLPRSVIASLGSYVGLEVMSFLLIFGLAFT